MVLCNSLEGKEQANANQSLISDPYASVVFRRVSKYRMERCANSMLCLFDRILHNLNIINHVQFSIF